MVMEEKRSQNPTRDPRVEEYQKSNLGRSMMMQNMLNIQMEKGANYVKHTRDNWSFKYNKLSSKVTASLSK